MKKKQLWQIPKGDINAQDNRGNTALIFASWLGHTEIVKLLKAAGARE